MANKKNGPNKGRANVFLIRACQAKDDLWFLLLPFSLFATCLANVEHQRRTVTKCTMLQQCMCLRYTKQALSMNDNTKQKQKTGQRQKCKREKTEKRQKSRTKLPAKWNSVDTRCSQTKHALQKQCCILPHHQEQVQQQTCSCKQSSSSHLRYTTTSQHLNAPNT